MAWNGSGVFSRTNGVNNGTQVWNDDKLVNTKVRADLHDTHDQDLADGINACLAKNGENAATANLNAGGFVWTNLGAGAANGQSVRYQDVVRVVDAQTIAGAKTWSDASVFSGTATFNNTCSWNAAATFFGITKVSGSGDTTFTCESTDSGVAQKPFIDIYRNSASPANNDNIGSFRFIGKNSAASDIAYSYIDSVIEAVTSTSESGRIRFNNVQSGSFGTRFNVSSGFWANGATGGDKGANSINSVSYYRDGNPIKNWDYLGTLTLSAATVADFTDLTGYDQYMFLISDLTFSAATDLRMRMSTDNGSTFITSTSYDYAGSGVSVSTNTVVSGNNAAQAIISHGIAISTSSVAMHGTIIGFGLGETNVRKSFGFRTWQEQEAIPEYLDGIAAIRDINTAINAIRLYPGNGNFTGKMMALGRSLS